MNFINNFLVSDIKCSMYYFKSLEGKTAAGGLPVIFMPGSTALTMLLPDIMAKLELEVKAGTCGGFLFVYFDVDSWEDGLTPWETAALSKKTMKFTGQAGKTLDFIRRRLMPFLQEQMQIDFQKSRACILGYSLGGLFALWAFCEDPLFSACASCSGSLWYDGWMDYFSGRKFHEEGRVLLCLGEREKNTRNPRMRTIEDQTMAVFQELNGQIQKAAYKLYSGGHFDHVEDKIIDGVCFLAGEV